MPWTRVAQCGFETYSLQEWIQENFRPVDPSTDDAYTGVRSAKASGVFGGIGAGLSATVSQLRAGWAIRHAGCADTVNIVNIKNVFSNVDDAVLSLKWHPLTYQVKLYEYGVETQTYSALALGLHRMDLWQHWGVNYKAGASGWFSFYIDGQRVINYTGSVFPSTDGLMILGADSGSAWQINMFVDDFYVDQGSGEGDSAPPQYRYLWSNIASAGSDADWSPLSGNNFEMVDEGGAPDDDTTYNYAAAASLRDTFSPSAVAVPANHTVESVIVTNIARKGDAQYNSRLRAVLYDGANLVLGDDKVTPMDYDLVWERFTTKPAGGAWDQASFNAVDLGYESAGNFR